MKAQLPSIYKYNNFRKFLEDYQKARFRIDKDFTKSFICKKLGLPKTRSYFNDVVNGKEVTKTFLERFIKLFGFDKHETQFFRALVQFNQAENADEREFYFEQLISLNKTPAKTLEPKIYTYHSAWYYSSIRSLLDVYDFSDDFGALAKKINPPISIKQAKESINLLLDLNLIEKNTQGFYKPTEKALSSGGPDSQHELLKQYQLQCLDLAKKALLSKGNENKRNYTTNTFSLSKEGYERLKRRIKKFNLEIRSLVHKDENPATDVYQLNMQFFSNSN